MEILEYNIIDAVGEALGIHEDDLAYPVAWVFDYERSDEDTSVMIGAVVIYPHDGTSERLCRVTVIAEWEDLSAEVESHECIFLRPPPAAGSGSGSGSGSQSGS